MRNFAKILLPTIIYTFSLFLIISLANRFASPNELSIFLLVNSIAAPIFLLFGSKANTLLSTDAISNLSFSQYSVSRALLGLTSTLATLIFTFFLYNHDPVDNFSKLFLLSILVCLFKLIEQQDELELANFIKDGKYGKFGLIKIRRSLIILFTFPIIFYYFSFITAYSVTIFILGTASLISAFHISQEKLSISIKSALINVKSIFKTGFTLSLSSSVSSLASNIPRYVGFYFLNSSDFVVLGSILYLSSIYSLFINSLAQFYLPAFKKNKHTTKEKSIFIESQLINFLAFLLISITIYFFGGLLLNLIYGEEYANYSWALILLFFSLYFKGTIALYGTLANIHGKYGVQLKASIFSVFVVFILSSAITPFYGLLGIFISIIISSLFELLFYRIFIFKK